MLMELGMIFFILVAATCYTIAVNKSFDRGNDKRR